MIFLIGFGIWFAVACVIGLWLGKAIKQADHEAHLQDIYRRRIERERNR